MDYAKEGESSRRAHLKQRAKSLKINEIFDDEDLPEEISYFHGLFFEIWNASDGLTYQNIYYWQKIYGVQLQSDIISMFMIVAGKANTFIKTKLKPKGTGKK